MYRNFASRCLIRDIFFQVSSLYQDVILSDYLWVGFTVYPIYLKAQTCHSQLLLLYLAQRLLCSPFSYLKDIQEECSSHSAMPTSLPISAFAQWPVPNQDKGTLINAFFAWTVALDFIFVVARVITRKWIVSARLWCMISLLQSLIFTSTRMAHWST